VRSHGIPFFLQSCCHAVQGLMSVKIALEFMAREIESQKRNMAGAAMI